jgi:hypothetical protein
MSLLTLETAVPKDKLRAVRAYGGFPLQASQVVKGIEAQLHARPEHAHAHDAASVSRANGGGVRV